MGSAKRGRVRLLNAECSAMLVCEVCYGSTASVVDVYGRIRMCVHCVREMVVLFAEEHQEPVGSRLRCPWHAWVLTACGEKDTWTCFVCRETHHSPCQAQLVTQ